MASSNTYSLSDYESDLELCEQVEFEPPTPLPSRVVSKSAVSLSKSAASSIFSAGVVRSSSRPRWMVLGRSVMDVLGDRSNNKEDETTTHTHTHADPLPFHEFNGEDLLKYCGLGQSSKWGNLMMIEEALQRADDQSSVIREFCVLLEAVLCKLIAPQDPQERALIETHVRAGHIKLTPKQQLIVMESLKRNQFTFKGLQLLLIGLRRGVKVAPPVEDLHQYTKARVSNPKSLLEPKYKQLIQLIDQISTLRNNLVHRAFQGHNGRARVEVFQSWLGRRSFKQFYHKSPPRETPLIYFVISQICALNGLDLPSAYSWSSNFHGS